ncbi:MAG: hypothetical protein GX294_04900 [Candidatus Cloacimonetes bacterium]|nr:hypothetical protein [Candidatus Cloacimonadota bacterium]
MHKRYYIIILMALTLLLTACERPVKREERSALNQEINSYMVQILSEAEELQTTALQDVLDDSPSNRFYENGKAYRRNLYLQTLKARYEDLESQKIEVFEPRSIVMGRNSVVWTAQISTQSTDKDGNTHAISSSETWVWQKIDNYWRVLHLNSAWAN